MSRLYFSPFTGHAYIEDDGRPKYVIDLKVGRLRSAKGTHVNVWMLGYDDIVVIPAGDHPFTEAIATATHAYRRRRAKDMLRCCLDGVLGSELRCRAADVVEKWTADTEDYAALRAYAETMDIPASADFSLEFTGRVEELVAIIKRRHSAVVSQKG